MNRAHLHNKKTNYFQLAFITLRSKFSEFPINLEPLIGKTQSLNLNKSSPSKPQLI